MISALLILLALQGAMISPADVKSANSLSVDTGASLGGPCRGGVPIQGKLSYPAYSTPIPFTNVEIYDPLQLAFPVADVNSDAWAQFHAKLRPGQYVAVITTADGMAPLRQRFAVDCTAEGIQLVIMLHPAAKPGAVPSEDTIAIESLRAKPNDYDRDLAAGQDYDKKGDRENAVRAFGQALKTNSGSMPARRTLGEYAFEAGQFQLAAELLGQAVRLGSMSSEVYYMLGVSSYKLNRLDIAHDSLIRALEIDPNISKAYLELYNVYMKAKMPEKALEAAQAYLDKYPAASDRAYVQSIVDKQRKSAKPTP